MWYMSQLHLNLIWAFLYVDNMQDIDVENMQGKSSFRLQDGICQSFVYILCPGFSVATWKNNQVWYEYR